jgi:SNF2 family DNA or RNA helicase
MPTGKGFGFLFEMGCGKTLTAIAVMGALCQRGKIQRVLIVAPSTVVPVWPKELESMADFPFISCVMLGGDKKKRLKKYRDMMAMADMAKEQALRVVCINYDEIFREGVFETLLEYGADLIILDEGHYIKTYTSKTSKAAYELGQRAKYRLLLTGTPVTGKNTDIFGLFRFIDPRVFGTNFYAFRNRYCVLGGFKGKQIVGAKNNAELTKKMHENSLRVTKKDALDLPEETYENRYVVLSRAESEAYESLRRTGLAELEGGEISAPLVITKMLRMQQVVGGFAKLDETEKPQQLGRSKLDALSEIIDQCMEAGEKLVIFARFLPEVAAICQEVENKGIGYGVIFGEIKQEDRGNIVEDFQTNPETRIFIAQIQTAGLGITLHASSVAVFYSLDFSYANYSQATARIHRIGQKKPCLYMHLIAQGTIDEQILKALEEKQDLSKTICDNWRQYFLKEDSK